MPPFNKILPFILLAICLYAIITPLRAALSRQDPIKPDSLTGEYDPTATQATFHGLAIVPPTDNNPTTPYLSSVLGDTSAEKRIEVDLTHQKLYAFEGSQKVYEFFISSGKWYPTPTGTFQIWGKFRYTKMSGGNPTLHTYYYLPNVPFVMFFGNDAVPASRGFSLHGTYWHNNFGHPMSHGCVNMRTEDAEKIFYWSNPAISDQKTARASRADPGTTIVIYGTAPKE